MLRIRRTLSVKLIMVFFPAIMIFLMFGFFVLRHKSELDASAAVRRNDKIGQQTNGTVIS